MDNVEIGRTAQAGRKPLLGLGARPFAQSEEAERIEALLAPPRDPNDHYVGRLDIGQYSGG